MSQSKTAEMFPVPDSRMVLWYYRGDISQQPRLAIVTSFGRRAGLELSAIEMGAPQLRPVSGVRHKDDPYHKDHLEHSHSCGVWDYLPGQGPLAVSAVTPETTEIAAPGSVGPTFRKNVK
jgi:hypothetical protein